MRFIPVNCIKDGMICGKKLYGKNGELLLNEGTIIHNSYINTLKLLGYAGIYIDDDLSKEIEILEIIDSNLRIKAVNSIKNVLIGIENGKAVSDKSINIVNNVVGEIIDNILSNRQLIVNMIDLKVFDDYTFYHSVNVGVLSIIVGTSLNFNKNQLHDLGMAALLHDIGKVFIPKEILNKPGKLTEQEYEQMKTHSIKGYEYLKERFDIPTSSYVGVLHHHERFDGGGYPNSTSGAKISEFGRIIAIADVYDALTSNRPYRKAIIPSEATELIMGASDSMFDPHIVNTFIGRIAPFPVGTCVSLSNNKIGIVVENYSDCCLRPKIKIVKHKDDKEIKPYYIDLRNDRSTLDTTIVGISDISFEDEK